MAKQARPQGRFYGTKAAETQTVEFEPGHMLEGLTVELRRRVPLGVVLGIRAGRNEELVELLARKGLVSWNLFEAPATEGEEPAAIPITAESIRANFTFDEADALVGAWLEAVTQASPLPSSPSSESES